MAHTLAQLVGALWLPPGRGLRAGPAAVPQSLQQPEVFMEEASLKLGVSEATALILFSLFP